MIHRSSANSLHPTIPTIITRDSRTARRHGYAGSRRTNPAECRVQEELRSQTVHHTRIAVPHFARSITEPPLSKPSNWHCYRDDNRPRRLPKNHDCHPFFADSFQVNQSERALKATNSPPADERVQTPACRIRAPTAGSDWVRIPKIPPSASSLMNGTPIYFGHFASSQRGRSIGRVGIAATGRAVTGGRISVSCAAIARRNMAGIATPRTRANAARTARRN
eukprot:3932778-Rhodomonas_salina.3